MTKFEQIGVDIIDDTRNIQDLRRAYDRSCSICIRKGYHLICDYCAIADKYLIHKAFLEEYGQAE